MAQNPLDFFIRRTGRLYFDLQSVEKLKEPILKEFLNIFNWDKPTEQKYRKEIEKAVLDAVSFKI